MKQIFALALITVALSGCGKSTEQICKETDQVLKQATGQGFADVGWIGCLKQSPSEANQSLEALRQAKGIKSAELKSHEEVNKLVESEDPLIVITQLGHPDRGMFWPSSDSASPVGQQPSRGIDYSTSRNAPVAEQDPKMLEAIKNNISNRIDGDYRFAYERPISYGLMGLEDEQTTFFLRIRNGEIIYKSASVPKHLWESWFN